MTFSVDERLAIALEHHQSGRLAEAKPIYEQVLATQPDHVEAWRLLGTVAHQQQAFARAIECYERSLSLAPTHTEAWISLGRAKQQCQDWAGAIFAYQQALTLRPDHAETRFRLGTALEKNGDFAAATQQYQQSLDLDPNQATVLQNLAAVLHKQGQLPEAIAHYHQAIDLDPNYAKAHLNLGTAYSHAGDPDASIDHYRQAIALQPIPTAYDGLGSVYLQRNQLPEAIDCYRAAIALDPNYAEGHFNLALALLVSGDLLQGFAEYEWRWRAKGAVEALNLPQQRWDGSSLQGQRILLHVEQGFGDAIQFVRYVPQAIAQGGRVTIGCPEPLVRLFQAIPGVEQVSHAVNPGEFDCNAPLMSLPHILGTTLDTVPAPSPYLNPPTPDPALTEVITRHGQDKFRVGIVWAGSAGNRGNHQRSCSLNDFLPLLDLPNLAVFSLQKGDRVQDLHSSLLTPRSSLIFNLDPYLNDFADTAAAIAQLDLVISVDTAVVHLAGSLGKPVWVVLAFSPDWRWLLEREDSPWYPTAQLFRQPEPGNWAIVFEQVRRELEGTIQNSKFKIQNSLVSTFDPPLMPSPPTPLPRGEGSKPTTPDSRFPTPDINPPLTPPRRGMQLPTPDSRFPTPDIDPPLTPPRRGMQLPTPDSRLYGRGHLAPTTPDSRLTDAIALHQSGDWPNAEQLYRQVLMDQPDHVDGLRLLGALMQQMQRLPEAIALYEQVLAIDPVNVEVRRNLGLAFREQERWAEAADQYQQLVHLDPSSEIYERLGEVLEKQGEVDAAIEQYQQAIALDPSCATAYANLAAIWAKQGEVDAAIEQYQRAIALDPNFAEAYGNLANLLVGLNRIEEAIAYHQRTVDLRPDYAEAFSNLGTALTEQNRIEEAIAAYRRAVALKPEFPEAHDNLGVALLQMGELRSGFAEREWRWHCTEFRQRQTLTNFPYPAWDGSPLVGRTILLYSEQGFGDIIQFIRYAPLVKAQGATVIVRCQLGLKRLFATVDGIDRLITKHDPLPEADCCASLMSLPHLLGTTLETIPATIPYLTSPLPTSPIAPSPALKIGIAWAANSQNPTHRKRSCRLANFFDLFSTPNTEFHSLQKEIPEADQQTWSDVTSVLHDWRDRLQDFADTAAIVRDLDLVITVDTAVAHLAGAMGKPVWILLPFAADWRWMLDRTDSPWYPTARLFRQSHREDWTDVLEQIQQELEFKIQNSKFKIQVNSERQTIPTQQDSEPNSSPLTPHSSLLLAAFQAHQSGQLAEAESLYRQEIARNPENSEAWQLLGTLYCQSDRLSEGIEFLQQAIALNPLLVAAHSNLAVVMQQSNRPQEAIDHYQQAIAIQPDSADFHFQIGLLLKQQEDLTAAAQHYQQAIALNPSHNQVHHYLANIYQAQERWSEAIALYHQAIALNPESADVHNNLGAALICQQRLAEAVPYLRQAIALKPDHAASYYNLGRALQEQDLIQDSIEIYQQAIAIQPDYADAHINLSLALLTLGEFARGLEHYEWRWQQTVDYEHPITPQSLGKPLWDGSDFHGKTLLVYCEQGYGDSIQFLRYLPWVAQRGDRIIFECSRALVRLFQGQSLPNVMAIVPRKSPLPEFDLQIPLLSLPRIFGTTIDSIPAPIPYITPYPSPPAPLPKGEGSKRTPDSRLPTPSADPPLAPPRRGMPSPPAPLPNGEGSQTPHSSLLTPPSLRCGLVWATGSKSQTREQRSCSLRSLWPILQVEGVEFYSLQKDIALEDETVLATVGSNLHDLRSHLNDFADTAALIAELDLVITIDTAVAHLAGAMGKPVWILLPVVADWRWFRDRTDSPWYPTAKLFRQSSAGDWTPILDRVAQELRSLVQGNAQQISCSRSSSVLPTPDSRFPIPDFSNSSTMPDIETLILNAFHHHQAAEYDQAKMIYEQVVALNPNHLDALQLLGTLYCQQEQYTEGVEYLQRAIALNPDFAEGHYNLAAALQNLERSEEAIAHYQQAIEINQAYPEAHLNLGNIYKIQERWSESQDQYRKAIALNPSYSKAWRSLGVTFQAQGDFDTAIQHYQRAIACQPDYADAYSSWGYSLIELGRLDEAMERYDQAIAIDTDHVDARFGQAAIRLRQGDYLRGFEEYEWRWKYDYCPPREFPRPVWDGSDLTGKIILLHDEQGFGDGIQAIRYAPWVKDRGGWVMLECRGALKRLFSTVKGIDQIIERGKALPAFDYHAPLMSLPHIFRSTLDTIPNQIPYLSVPQSAKLQLSDSRRETLRIGLVWMANPINKTGKKRSCPLTELESLLTLPKTTFFSLQKDLDESEQQWLQRHQITDLSPQLEDFAETAAAIAQLDLVITVDTAVAHLAGALGKPVWILLPFMSDWRWLTDRNDSPWYPTARLFRQPQWKDWTTVIAEVKYALCTELLTTVIHAPSNPDTSFSVVFSHSIQSRQGVHESILNDQASVLDSELIAEGIAKHQAGEFQSAESLYRQALISQPQHPDVLRLLGALMQQMERKPEAIALYEQVLIQQPNNLEVRLNLGLALRDQGQFDDAISHYQQVLQLDPTPKSYVRVGDVFAEKGDFATALSYYQQAIALDPNYVDAQFRQAISHLRQGDYLRGFEEYEWRWCYDDYAAPQRFPQPLWNGASLAGKTILLYDEQGFGDAIQVIRYIPWVKASGGTVILKCRRDLVRLLATVSGVDHVLDRSQPTPSFDYHAPLMSLPHIFQSTLETIPNDVPYLSVPSSVTLRLPAEDSQHYRIGLVWSTNPLNHTSTLRSCSLQHWGSLMTLPGSKFFSLQKDVDTEEQDWLQRHEIVDLSDQLTDFAETAAAIAQLDLIITVDTAVAHLAGALGKPVWILLPFMSDWRWLTDRNDSPWYPTARLFRQPKGKDWTTVIADVKYALFTELLTTVIHSTSNLDASYSVVFSHSIQSRQGVHESILNDQASVLDSECIVEGIAKHQAGEFQVAEECYRQVLLNQPQHSDILRLLGALMQQTDRKPEAIALYQQVLMQQPNNVEVLLNLGLVLRDQGQFDDAISQYQQVLHLEPTPKSHVRVGDVFAEKGDFATALSYYQQAIAIDPNYVDAQFRQAIIYLRQGDYLRGFEEYEWRWRYDDYAVLQRFPQPLWNGTSLTGKTILLYDEQGFGDAIQAIRYIPWVKASGGTVILKCRRELVRLLATVSGVDQVLERSQPNPSFDYHAPLMSLSHIFRSTLETIPNDVPYLAVPSSVTLRLPAKDSQHYRIGWVWSTNPLNHTSILRSCSLPNWESLVTLPGSKFFSLQKDIGTEEQEWLQQHEIIDLSAQLTDFAETAAAIAQLDLVITVDTAVAHLAGALGKPVWILLPFMSDWRWLTDRNDSPWYPTARLFRQPGWNDWATVMAEVKQALQEEIQNSKFKIQNFAPSFSQGRRNIQPITSSTPHASRLTPHYQQGLSLQKAGQIEAAIAQFQQVIAIQPDHLGANRSLGYLFQQQEKWSEAIAHYQRALAIQPNAPELHVNLGNIFAGQGDNERAIAYYRQAIDANPSFVEAYVNLGVTLQNTGHLTEAIAIYRQAIALKPGMAELHTNLGSALQHNNQSNEAIAQYQQAIAANPNYAAAYYNLAVTYQAIRQAENALNAYQQALAVQPDLLDARVGLGTIYLGQHRLSDAIEQYQQAIAIDGNDARAHYNLATALLLQGHWQAGFSEYEWRWNCQEFITQHSPARSFDQPQWNGGNLHGKVILVHCEQGIGDSIQFVRYLPLLAQRRASRIILECPASLSALFASLSDVAEIVVQGRSLPAFDVHIPLMSLSHALNAMPDTVSVPYLAVPQGRSLSLSDTGKLRVGLVWAANRQSVSYHQRSCSLHQLLPLLEQKEVEFYSLQKEVPTVDQPLLSSSRYALHDLSEQLNDFTDTAVAIAQLDLVITIDTAVAHLAGALGKPVWILLPYLPDWRWTLSGNDTPWYPTARLFRQPKPEDWSSAIEQVQRELELKIQNSKFKIQNSLGSTFDPPLAPPRRGSQLSTPDSTISDLRSPDSPQGRAAVRPFDEPAPFSIGQAASSETVNSALIPTLQRALGHYNAGELDTAWAIAQSLLPDHPCCFELLQLLGGIAFQKRQMEQAEQYYRPLVTPGNQVEFVGIASTEPQQRETEVNSKFAEVYRNLSMVLREQGKIDEAIKFGMKAIKTMPDLASAYLTLGMAYQRADQLNRAIATYHHALALQPDFPEVITGIGSALYYQGNLNGAVQQYEKALALKPDYGTAHCDRALVWLLQGDLVNGFAEYEWRWVAPSWEQNCPRRNFSQPRWDGGDLTGKTILLHFEQGLGDTLQFVRYAAIAKAKGGRVIVECQRSLVRLLQNLANVDQIIPDGQSLPHFDVYAPLLSVPHILGTTLDTIPAQIPYLQSSVSLQLSQIIANYASGKYRVGVVWGGNPNHWNDRQRSCSVDAFRVLLDIPEVAFFSLQKGDRANDLINPQSSTQPTTLLAPLSSRICDLAPYLNDFADTAEAVANLDLVISVDTSVVHLAGAMGKPVWVLLSYMPDWRWLLHREESPWYPTAKLFRQPQSGQWGAVFERVRQELIQNSKFKIQNLPTQEAKPKQSSGSSSLTPSSSLLPPHSSPLTSSNLPQTLALFRSASQHFQAGRMVEAEQCCRQALSYSPNHVDTVHLLGVVLHHLHQTEEAIALYEQTLAMRPDHAEAHGNLAILRKQQGQIEEAAQLYRRAIELNPRHALAHCNLGNILQEWNQYNEAIAHYHQALAASPHYPKAWNNMGNALARTEQRSEAIAAYEKAIEQDPNYAEAYSNLANVHCEYGDLATGLSLHERAIALKPDYAQAHQNYSIAILRTGNFPKGFAEFEWRWRLPEFQENNARPHTRMPRWDGSPLQGQTVLLWTEQGFGDAIQFIRYIPLVRQRGGKVLVECSPPLVRLFESLQDIEGVTAAAQPTQYQFQLPVMSVPLVMGTTVETIPNQVPYLFAPPTSQVQLKEPPMPSLKIAIVWAAKLTHPTHKQRSASLQHFLPLINLPGVMTYSLQKDVPPTDQDLLRSLSDAPNFQDISSQLQDFADTAYVMEQMDLVISVDTAVVHLAGAMAKPLWVLLSKPADWRWLLDRDDNDWYPTARVFRQSTPGHWTPVFEQVRQELHGRIQNSKFKIQNSSTQAQDVAESTAIESPQDQSQSSSSLAPDSSLQTPDSSPADSSSRKSKKAMRKANKKSKRAKKAEKKAEKKVKAKQPKALGFQPQSSSEPPSDSHERLDSSVQFSVHEQSESSTATPVASSPQRSPADRKRIRELLETAVAHHHAERLSEAELIYRQILQDYPQEPNAVHLLGVIAYQRNDFETAIAQYRQAVALKPDYAEIHNNLAVALDKVGDSDGSIYHYQRSIALKPDYAEAWQNLGTIYQGRNQFDEAIRHYQKSIELRPGYADAYNSWASALKRLNRLQDSLDLYNQALHFNPEHLEARCGRAAVLLQLGDLQQGFVEYEWRWKHADCPPRKLPKEFWTGEPFHGRTLLIYAEQGLGDTIQCIRYLPMIRQLGDRVVLELNQPGLERLFSTLDGLDQIVIAGDSLPHFDLKAPIMSLPRILGTTLDTIPADIPYLSVPEDAQVTLPDASSRSLKIGTVWTANRLSKTGQERSCELSLFQSFLQLPGVQFYSLQKDVTPEDAALLSQHNIPSLGPDFNDLADTAAAIAQLDLVITVDTVIAHLAGALGKPTWVLLPFACDWRWLSDRTDTPWYPTLRLFRQPDIDQWQPVVEAIATELQTIVANPQTLSAESSPAPAFTVTPSPSLSTQPKSMTSTASAPVTQQPLGVGWPMNLMTGWGNFGLNLVLQLQQMADFMPVVLAPVDISDSLNPLQRELLQPVLAEQNRLQQLAAQNPGKQIQVNIPVLHALGNRLQGGLQHIRGDRNVGVIFLEDTHLPPDALERGRQHVIIAAGSKWNEEILRSKGLNNAYSTPQGIDPTRFHPAPKSNLLTNRFVVFSGGKLEYRKGQDIVVAAFKRFVVNHPDAVLITAWHNFWPQFMAGIDLMGHVVGLPQLDNKKRLRVKEWLSQNGVPPQNCINVGPIPNYLMGQVVREADVAVFPNRCEGGTNLAAMECMACGIPTILSANTGHLDLVDENHCYPLRSQSPARSTQQFIGVEGWGESDVDEIVAALEDVYTHRQASQRKGLAAAKFMEDWTWEKQIYRLCEVLKQTGVV